MRRKIPLALIAIMFVIGLVLGVLGHIYAPVLPVIGECYRDYENVIYRVRSVGKYSAYFEAQDPSGLDTRALFAFGEIPERLRRVDCPESFRQPCPGGAYQCSR